MKQVHFLTDIDTAFQIYLREVYRYDSEIQIRPTDDVERRVLKSIRNRIAETAYSLIFSKHVNDAFGNKAAVTDVDRVLYIRNRIAAIFEMKRRNEDFKKCIMANARQFFILRKIARRLDVPLYYVYRINEYPKEYYRLLEVDLNERVDVKNLGKGHANDYYTLWPLERSVVLAESQFVEFLRGLR